MTPNRRSLRAATRAYRERKADDRRSHISIVREPPTRGISGWAWITIVAVVWGLFVFWATH